VKRKKNPDSSSITAAEGLKLVGPYEKRVSMRKARNRLCSDLVFCRQPRFEYFGAVQEHTGLEGRRCHLAQSLFFFQRMGRVYRATAIERQLFFGGREPAEKSE